MRPSDVLVDFRLLPRLVRRPEELRYLTPQEFSQVLDTADSARLLGWLIAEVDRHGLFIEEPDWLVERVTAARAIAAEYERTIRWEVDRIRRAFWGLGLSWVLLKGAAYVAAALPPGHGRRVADIDVLVPGSQLEDAEAALRRHGWDVLPLDSYDERYYREWMHELPPLVHRDRGSVVDLHHAILPTTSRLRPSTHSLVAASVIVSEDVRVLSPAHMMLHSAVHLFHDGQIAGAIRDLVDLDALFRHFASTPGFWTDFLTQAGELGLTRPAHYAVRFTRSLLGTPINDEVLRATDRWGPPSTTQRLMDLLVGRTIETRPLSSAAAYALYVRSHWLRMPPVLLTRHLLRKAVRPG